MIYRNSVIFNFVAGFKEGFIQFNDQDIFTNNKAGGTLPDGVYDGNTKIFFCCRLGETVAMMSVLVCIHLPSSVCVRCCA